MQREELAKIRDETRARSPQNLADESSRNIILLLCGILEALQGLNDRKER